MCFSRQCFFMLPPSCESLYLKECTQVWCNNGTWCKCAFSFIFCQRSWATHYLNIFFCFSWGFEIAAGWKEMKISGTSPKIVLTKPKKFASYSASVIWSSSETFSRNWQTEFTSHDWDIHRSWDYQAGLFAHWVGINTLKSFAPQGNQRADKKL